MPSWVSSPVKAKSYQTTAKTLSTVAKGLAEEANQATLTAAEKRRVSALLGDGAEERIK